MIDAKHSFQTFKRLTGQLNMGALVSEPIEWSGLLLHQKVNVEIFKTLTKAYFKSQTSVWKTSAKQGFIGWLGHCVLAWTEFNLRRMLGDISPEPSEIKKGQDIINQNMIPCLNYIENNEAYLLEIIELGG